MASSEFQPDENMHKQNMNEFLKTVQPSSVNTKELDILLKSLFSWIGEKSYIPTSQETRISMTYNFLPFVSGLFTSYLTSITLKRFGVPRGVLHTFPVALMGISTIASTSNYARKAVNYRLMQLHTPMGDKMIEIIKDYRAHPEKYEEVSKLDMFSYRKLLNENKKKMEGNQLPKDMSMPPPSEMPGHTSVVSSDFMEYDSDKRDWGYNIKDVDHNDKYTQNMYNSDPLATTHSDNAYTYNYPDTHSENKNYYTDRDQTHDNNYDTYPYNNTHPYHPKPPHNNNDTHSQNIENYNNFDNFGTPDKNLDSWSLDHTHNQPNTQNYNPYIHHYQPTHTRSNPNVQGRYKTWDEIRQESSN